jgi:hypothetical protein
MSKALKEYESIDGRNFLDDKHEKLIRDIVKLAGKRGWKYSQTRSKGKTFCTTESSSYHPKGETVKETVTIEFTWQKFNKVKI